MVTYKAGNSTLTMMGSTGEDVTVTIQQIGKPALSKQKLMMWM